MPDDPTTQELRAIQDRRAQTERAEAERADSAPETQAHERRADKAGYLRAKLDEQAAADGDGTGA